MVRFFNGTCIIFGIPILTGSAARIVLHTAQACSDSSLSSLWHFESEVRGPTRFDLVNTIANGPAKLSNVVGSTSLLAQDPDVEVLQLGFDIQSYRCIT